MTHTLQLTLSPVSKTLNSLSAFPAMAQSRNSGITISSWRLQKSERYIYSQQIVLKPDDIKKKHFFFVVVFCLFFVVVFFLLLCSSNSKEHPHMCLLRNELNDLLTIINDDQKLPLSGFLYT